MRELRSYSRERRCDRDPVDRAHGAHLPLDALETGESNVEVTDQIMRYATPGNLTGLPAISWVAGYDSNGLPIGFQAMGRAWEEHLLLRLAMVGEGLVRRRKPRVHHRLLAAT